MKKYHIADDDWGVRHRLDVRRVLEHYGAEHCQETISERTGETWIVHSCLLDRVESHHTNGDQNPSAWVNVETGHYVCATYWGGDLFRLVQKLEGKEELEECIPAIGHLLAGTRNTEQAVAEIERLFAERPHDVPIATYSDRLLRPWAVTHPYMSERRGVSHQACELLRIGWDPKANRIIFPHFWHGNLVGWQARAIPPATTWPGTEPQQPKYKNTHGFPKSQTLYGYDAARRHIKVLVVESPMSVAKAYSFGLDIMADLPVVATFGAKVSRTQIDLLKGFPHVIVWFDDDVAGHGGERKLVEGLYRHTTVTVVDPDERDLGDHDDVTEVRRKLELARPAALWLAENGGTHAGRRRGSRER